MLRTKLLTDKRGQVLLPKLSFGTYCIFASAKPHLKATLYLNFFTRRRGQRWPLLDGASVLSFSGASACLGQNITGH